MVHIVLCLLVAFALQAVASEWVREGSGPSWKREAIAAAAGGLIGIDGLYLFIHPPPGGSHWFGVQLLICAVFLLVVAAAAPLARAQGRTPLARLPLVVLLGIPIIVASLQNGTRVLGSTSSRLYPTRYYVRTPEITFAESACASHRTVVLGDALPSNVADVYRRLRTENGHGATLHAPFLDFIGSTAWSNPRQTRLLDERCIVSGSPISVPGYRAAFHNPGDGVTVYVNDYTSPLNTPQLQPIPAIVLRSGDRDLRYRFDLTRPTTVIVSAIVYPGWHVRVDDRSADVGSFRVGKVPVFPEVTLPAGPHTLQYSWSGWPA
jgi:hypothetical protein